MIQIGGTVKNSIRSEAPYGSLVRISMTRGSGSKFKGRESEVTLTQCRRQEKKRGYTG